MSSGKRSVTGSVRGAGENGSAESSKERGGMRGMVERRRPARSSLVFVIDKYVCAGYWVPLLKTLANTSKMMAFHPTKPQIYD